MPCIIQGKPFLYHTDIRDNQPIRESFFALARRTFGLDFSSWYQNGWWGGNYIPHVLLDKERVVANVSVNLFHSRLGGVWKTFVQLGTVMTATEYRNQGLGRFLLEKVLDEWRGKCDGIYLFANNSVLDYYPKFGFERAREYECSLPVTHSPGDVQRLNMDSPADRELLLSRYALSNPFSALPMLDNTGLLMFYCGQYLKENVYYLPDFDAVAVAEHQSGILLCHDIFCREGGRLENILSVLAGEDTRRADLGFSPRDVKGYAVSEYKEEDTTLFFLKGGENPMENGKYRFPFLSHA